MQYFRVKNWDKYQIPAKKSGIVLPWIRLDTALLDDPKTYAMTALEFACWVKILLWARRFDNKIPLEPRWICEKLGFRAGHKRGNLAYLFDLDLIEAFPAPGLTDRTDGLTGDDESKGGLGPLLGQASNEKKIPECVLELNKKFGLKR